MAQDYSIKLTGDSSQLTKTLGDVKDKFEKISNSTAPLKRKLADIKKLMAQMNLDGLSNTDVFQQLAMEAGRYADAIGDAQTATAVFSNDNMKLQAMAQGFQAITGAASVLTGTLGMLGVENKKVEEAMLKVQSAIALVNGVTAIANALNKDSTLMLRLKQIRMLANTAATAKNTVAETAGTAAVAANTVATGTNTAATVVATKGKNKLNTAVAIGKALMGDWTGLVLVGAAALATYAIATSSSTDATAKANQSLDESSKALQAAQKRYNDFSSATAANCGNLVGKFQSLKREWDNLTTKAEKTEWLKNNQSAFANLGMSINDLVTAENVFANNTSKIVKALEARAKAMAAQNMMTDAYADYYKQKQKNASSVEGGGYYRKAKEGDKVEQDELIALLKSVGSVNKTGGAINDGSYKKTNGNFILTEKGANALNEKRQAEARERRKNNDTQAENELNRSLDFLSKEAQKAGQEISKLGLDKVVKANGSGEKSDNAGGSKSGGSKSVSKTEKIDYLVSVDDGSLETAEKKLQAFTAQKKTINIDDKDALSECQKNIDKWQSEVEKRKIALSGIVIESGSKTDIENQIKKLEENKKILFNAQADPADIKKVDDEIKELKKQLEAEEIRLGLRPEIQTGSLNDIRKQISEKEDEISLSLNTVIDVESMKKLQSELFQLRQREKEKSIEIGIKTNEATISKKEENWERGSVEDKRQSLNNAQSMVSEIQENYRLKLIGKDEVQSQLSQINEQLESLGLKPITLTFNDDGSLTTAAENLENYKSKMSAVSDMAGSMGSVFGSLGSAIGGTTGEVLNFAGQSINAIAQIIPQIVSMIAAKEAEAIAAGTASGASMPFPANIAAIAGIVATIAGVFASLPKFESGGIVGGSSFTGDKLLARVNSGEMILNKTQQRNLYNSMNNAEIGQPMQSTLKGDVKFEISGSSLKGALKNYDSKMSKIR